MRNTLTVSFVMILGFTAAGCKPASEPLRPVSGKVLFDGKPLHKGDVVFVPDAEKGNTHLQFGIGKLASDGTYTAQTIQQDGVKAGWYKVMILASENEPVASASWVPIWIVPEKYTKPETTPLSIEVVPDPASGAYDFKIEK